MALHRLVGGVAQQRAGIEFVGGEIAEASHVLIHDIMSLIDFLQSSRAQTAT